MSQLNGSLRIGQHVLLDTPDNPRLHRVEAVVESLESWGAHVRCAKAATGKFRALFSEMLVFSKNYVGRVEEGYTGDICDRCGSSRIVRNGSCLLCRECGETSGCS
jgi:hypothetical protein